MSLHTFVLSHGRACTWTEKKWPTWMTGNLKWVENKKMMLSHGTVLSYGRACALIEESDRNE